MLARLLASSCGRRRAAAGVRPPGAVQLSRPPHPRQAIEGLLVLHVVDVAHELGLPEELLLQPGVAARERDRVVARRLAPHHAADGRPVLSPQWLEMEPAPDRHGVLLRFRVPVRARALGVQTEDVPLRPDPPDVRQRLRGRRAPAADDLQCRQRRARLLHGLDAGRAGRHADVHPIRHPAHPDRPGPHPVSHRAAAARRHLDGAR